MQSNILQLKGRVFMAQENIHEGDFYKHFKGKLYQIKAIATNSEDESLMVVYQALYPPFKIWVRPLSSFLEKLDKEKYPNATQIYRFEKISFDEYNQTPEQNDISFSHITTGNQNIGTDLEDHNSSMKVPASDITSMSDDSSILDNISLSDSEIKDALLSGQIERKLTGKLSDEQIAFKGFMLFLDAESYHDKYHIFSNLRPYLNDTILNNIAVTLDLVLDEGSPEAHFDTILNCLMTHEHYECNRLR